MNNVAVIFDMDGLLIDSEPFWRQAEWTVFSSVGVELSESLCAKTVSMTTREVTEFWYGLFPWQHKTLETVENEVIDCVDELIRTDGRPMPGVRELLQDLHERQYRIGLSTNSPFRLIASVMDRLEIGQYFHSISSSEHVENGKPDPAVYLSTLQKMQVDANSCIAFEDSVSGVLAAKAAGIKAVVVPPAYDFDDSKYEVADIKLRSLLDFDLDHLIL
tara:strand:- start:484 stop:1137 length:654 start_codon:yes stop_codon:yes gene_type:complete